MRLLLAEAIKQARDNSNGALTDLKLLRRELQKMDQKISRLFDALTDGTVTDTKGFRDQQTKLEARREELIRLISIKERETALPVRRLTNGQIKRFGEALSQMLQSGPIGFRKAYTQLLVDRVDVSRDEVRISGSKEALASAVLAQKTLNGPVTGFVREWRTRQDENEYWVVIVQRAA